MLNTDKRKFTFGKKNLLHLLKLDNLFDLELSLYLKQGDSLSVEKFKTYSHIFYEQLYRNVSHLNKIVPIFKHVEFLTKVKNLFKDIWQLNDLDSKEFRFYNDEVIPALFSIEKNGMKYDYKEFQNYFLEKSSRHRTNHQDYLFCQYHPYSMTGRPSNTFGGINFAALPKETGVRKVFNSRFDGGVLVEYDFESYHLRLIADMIKYQFPDEINIHEYFGKYYFGKDKLTKEEYNESKGISFRLLYGGIDPIFQQLPFFMQVDDLIWRLWQKFQRTGFIESPISHKKIYGENLEDTSKYKLWNYFIQLIETETSVQAINRIQKLLEGKNTKMILYTYDSFLFDLDMNEKELVIDIKKEFELKGKFPVTVSYGINYHDMKKIMGS